MQPLKRLGRPQLRDGWSRLSTDIKVGGSNPAPSQSAAVPLGKTLNAELNCTKVSGRWVRWWLEADWLPGQHMELLPTTGVNDRWVRCEVM